MHLEMRNVLGVNQVLLLHVVSAMVLLPVMNLIFVFIVAMVSWAEAKVWQLGAFRIFLGKFLQGNCSVFVDIKHIENSLDDHLLLDLRNRGAGFVFEAVGSSNILGCPETGVVVVVYTEEVVGVEARYVVLLCYMISQYDRCYVFYHIEIIE